MKRLQSIDITRGLVMVIMVLDHIRDMMHVTSLTLNPTDLATTTPVLFFTRWITHLCAPTFVFLSGASAYLSMRALNNLSASRWFLLTRGLWLIVLEFTVINFGLWFDIHFGVALFSVIAAIGFGFILLSALMRFSPAAIGIIGVAIIVLHNALAFIPFADDSIIKIIMSPFFGPAAYPIAPGTMFIMGYSPIPWSGILLAGFSLGRLFELQGIERKKIFLKIGAVCIALFVVLRFINLYGDPAPWSVQKNIFFTFFSFINVTKYPPSLLFTSVTLGTMFLLLYFFEGMKNKLIDILSVYGKVPLFYFVTHWYVIHPIMFAIVFLQGYTSADFVFGFNFGRPKGESGVELWAIYLIWISVVALFYPLCKWYGAYKFQHKEKRWLRYL